MIDSVKIQPHLLFLIWPQMGPFSLFGPFRAISLVGVRFKTFLGLTYVDNHLWFLEVQPYFFVFNFATFGASFALFWPFGAIFLALRGYFWGRGLVQKHFWNLPM